MTEHHIEPILANVQSAANQLASANTEGRANALEHLAATILTHTNHEYDSPATLELFSRELPDNIQRFAAVWLLRVIVESPRALQFENMEGRAALLFDRLFQRDIYRVLNIDPNAQTFEKVQSLADHLQLTLDKAMDLLTSIPHLNQVNSLQQAIRSLINGKTTRPFLIPLLPRALASDTRMGALFKAIADYTSNLDDESIHRYDSVCDVCDDFEAEANDFGTDDSKRILGRLARQLKMAVSTHFESLEAGKHPSLRFFAIEKKYPLEKPGTSIVLKIRIANDGTGPARNLTLHEIVADECLDINFSASQLRTIQPNESFTLDIPATVQKSSDHAKILIELSWGRSEPRSKETLEFVVQAQRHDIDWEAVELAEPYSLEAVTSENDLIGRKQELVQLLRLANNQNVGSGFIYGQKRVGKTSLANAVAKNLESNPHWIVISKGSGDYIGGDAISTMQSLGEVLVTSLKQRIPYLSNLPMPDFTRGLAPLSGFMDEALAYENRKILFILDEFDELPPDLLRRTDLSTSLFQPLRQISNKQRCGILLVGGEGMQQIMNLQGDRLNKFRPVELDYFSKSEDWSDFVELIRRPVQDWLTISDAALSELFESSAGNPYFAKLLASQLFSDLVKYRHSDASEVDMAEAVERVLTSIGKNSFAHFWTDGLVETRDNTEEMQIRRSVLIAAGRAFRKHITANADSIWQEFRNATGFPFEEQRFRLTLQDFMRRRVFVEKEHGDITAKIPAPTIMANRQRCN